MTGSYVAAQFGDRSVFIISFLLVVTNIVYIIVWLPETVKPSKWTAKGPIQGIKAIGNAAFDHLPSSWNMAVTFRIFK